MSELRKGGMPPRRSGWRQKLLTWTVAASFAGAGLLAPGLLAPASAAVTVPNVIPSVSGWSAASGSYTLAAGARIVASGDAAARGTLFAEELSAILSTEVPIVATGAKAGDIKLTIDESRHAELGDEGYALTIGSTIEIVGAAPQGVFYGTRTLAQMFNQQLELPAGSTVDVPKYAERGVTLCACQINISTDWIDRLLEEMSYLKLNQVVLELKVKSDEFPVTATWSYYTPAQVAAFVKKADARGIDVIPEINSPGHLEIWLENKPELQLVDKNGVKDEVRMDITKPEAFDFYTSLIDEYAAVFTTKYWHMGADEYMINSGFANFPQIGAYATAHWGANATPQDTVVDFVNRINDYVKSNYGKTLRIWNDALTGANKTVPLDSDIVVEHWQNTAVKPQDLINQGNLVVNNSYSLYIVRGGLKMNTASLYNGNWNVGTFYGGSNLAVDTPGLSGARISLWPDSAAAQTENQVEEEMFMPLRFIAQATWSATHALSTYTDFEAAARKIGRPIIWNNVDRSPVDGGTYTIADSTGKVLESDGSGLKVNASGKESWALTPTDDHYYRISSAQTGLCLDVVDGQQRLGVPVGIGVPVVSAKCTTSNIQKWQLIKNGDAFEVVNASTQERLAIDSSGAIVQLPADRTETLWTFGATLMVSAVTADPGTNVAVPVTVTNNSTGNYTGGTVSFTVPEGWSAAAKELATLAPGATTEVSMTVSVPEDTFPGDYVIPVTFTTDQGTFPGFFTVTVKAPEGEFITVQASQTTPGTIDQYRVGDRLSFKFSIKNLLAKTVAVVPVGDLVNFDPTAGGSNCRYQALGAGAGYDCVSAYHLVTQADLDAGFYAPATTWKVFDGGITGTLISTVVRQSPKVILTSAGLPTASASPTVTVSASATPSSTPSASEEPTTEPSVEPTTEPTKEPTTEPTTEPTVAPTTEPTVAPTTEPTVAPTTEPTTEPTKEPTTEPTTEPTVAPTTEPTTEPTVIPTTEPSVEPTSGPTTEPTEEPTSAPTTEPTATIPTTSTPTSSPTATTTAAPDQSSIELNVQQIIAGDQVKVSGSGFTAGEDVRIELHSTPVVLSIVTADAQGDFTTTVTIPLDTAAGTHSVVVIGVESGATSSRELTVAAATDSTEEPEPTATQSASASGAASATTAVSTTGGTGTTATSGTAAAATVAAANSSTGGVLAHTGAALGLLPLLALLLVGAGGAVLVVRRRPLGRRV